MTRNARAMLLVTAVAAVAVSMAGATPPSGQVGTLTSRGTIAEAQALKITVPQEVTVTQKYKVKVKGKFVTRTRKVKKTIDSPIISCGAPQCDVATQTVIYQPGGFSGWHHHPGVVFAVVKSGSITRWNGADCSKQTFTAGQTFVELGEHHVIFVKNEGSTVTEIEAVLVVPAGAPLRVEENAPASCNP